VKRLALLLLVLFAAPAFAQQQPITTASRIAWDMTFGTVAEIDEFSYNVYVDSEQPYNASLLSLVCVNSSGAPVTVTCSAKFPPMTAGVHAITVTSMTTINNTTFESDKSFPLVVNFVTNPPSLRAPTGLRVVQ
jgi:hypothetical protein